ncbi:hypothetical protein J31TS6_62240 [Brevibacillus reuszeri]|uniref:hypothetical protein n=1 Tax=Brevibacillus reuszeri TaxID=54915 RepID=UPI001AFE901E|nr:hypothetical protein [Brevibacillus reuszeri]GIO10196.1 hypothetical protein J31TS6_62240 [Brevibacillus reuszeri]
MGQGQEKIFSLLKDDGIQIERIGGKCRVVTNNAEALIKRIKFLAEDMKQKIVTAPYTDSTYDKVCDITLTDDQGGQLNYKMGHPGLGVAFNSGCVALGYLVITPVIYTSKKTKASSGSQREVPFSFFRRMKVKGYFSKIDENATPSFRQLSLQNSYVMAGGGPIGL